MVRTGISAEVADQWQHAARDADAEEMAGLPRRPLSRSRQISDSEDVISPPCLAAD